MEADFVELVAKPAGLERRKDQPLTAFAVLATRGDYENLLPLVRDPGDDAGRSAYDFQLQLEVVGRDRKSTRLNSSHQIISYAVFCLKKNTQPAAYEPSLPSPLTL